MEYRVEITARAEMELANSFAHIAAVSPGNAETWLRGFYCAAETLARLPLRCGIAPEASAINSDVRQYIYGSYRVLFVVESESVVILHIRHGARKFLTAEEFDQPS